MTAMFKALSRLFHFTLRSPRARRLLSEERRGHFFSWFNLEPDGEPKPAGSDLWLSFRPSGPAFHALVRLDVVVRGDDQIVGLELWVDRRFIDGKQSSSARDIVASFLGWALKDQDADPRDALIANIGNMRAANEPVIMRADAMPPIPPADRTGGYAVFTGRQELATIALGGVDLTLRNVTRDDHSRWFTVQCSM
jgi:hypothetical protein